MTAAIEKNSARTASMKRTWLGWLAAVAICLVAGCDSRGSHTPQPLSKEEAAKVMAERQQEEAAQAQADSAGEEAKNQTSSPESEPADGAQQPAVEKLPPGTLFIKVMAQPVNDALRTSQQSLQSAVLGGVTGGGNRDAQGETKAGAEVADQPAEGAAEEPAAEKKEGAESADSPGEKPGSPPESDPADTPKAEEPTASDNP